MLVLINRKLKVHIPWHTFRRHNHFNVLLATTLVFRSIFNNHFKSDDNTWIKKGQLYHWKQTQQNNCRSALCRQSFQSQAKVAISYFNNGVKYQFLRTTISFFQKKPAPSLRQYLSFAFLSISFMLLNIHPFNRTCIACWNLQSRILHFLRFDWLYAV